MLNLNASQHRLIGLDFILARVNTLTPFGETRKRALAIFLPGEEAALEEEHVEMEKCREYLDSGLFRPLLHDFARFKDITGTVERLREDQVLDEVEFFEIKQFAALCEAVRAKIAPLDLNQHLQPLTAVFDLLDPECTGLLTFQYYDAYSPLFKELRQAKRALEGGKLSESDKARERQRLNEELEEVTWQVRQDLSTRLMAHSDALAGNLTELGILDHRIAKADFARKWGCVRPEFSKTDRLSVTAMLNPMIEAALKEKGHPMEPLTLDLVPGSAILTGANMGGKSVTLKTFLLQMELFRRGYFLPCDAASLKLLDFVSYGPREDQDVSKGLSTFGMEVLEINRLMIEARARRGLIVMDEPARGTNPLEAQAIVKALCRYFKAGDDYFLLATHLPDLPEPGMRHFQIRGLKHLLSEGIKDWSTTEPREAIAALERNMDYRIREVSPETAVPREAIHVMEFLGSDPALMQEIKRILGEQHE